MRATLLFAAVTALAVPAFADVPKPAAIVADGIPAVPDDLAAKTRPYMEFRTAGFVGWHPTDKSMLIATRFANTAQLHRVAAPMMARKQISFESEPVGELPSNDRPGAGLEPSLLLLRRQQILGIGLKKLLGDDGHLGKEILRFPINPAKPGEVCGKCDARDVSNARLIIGVMYHG